MRRFASRFLLVGLVVAVVAFVITRAEEHGGGLVSIDGVRAEGQPEREAFRVDRAMRVAFDASGSFESGGADSVLAAQGWLVHRETGRVVWRMRPRQRPARGSYVSLRDTLALEPGTYDAVYAALGDPLVRAPREVGGGLGARVREFFQGGGRGWIGDADRWRLRIEPATDADRGLAERVNSRPGPPPGTLWTSAPMRSRSVRTGVFRVDAPAAIRVDALFEATPEATADSAYVVSASGDTLWSARYEGSAWAGGSVKNRVAADTLRLEPGTYRVVSRADRDHAAGSWTANPPWQPWRWGVRLSPADSAAASGAVSFLDPVEDFPRLVEIACVGERETIEVPFEVREALDVLVVAIGEEQGGTWYDYGLLLRGAGTVWDLRDAPTEHGGGGDKNRRAEADLRLEPGRYSLRYTTDGSYHCGDFGGDAPEPPDFWGIALVSADGREAGERLTVLAPGETDPLAGPAAPEGVLTSITRVESDRDVTGQFTLQEPAEVCVMGLGEIQGADRRDWARLTTRGDSTVWEMTEATTYAATPEASGVASTHRIGLARLALAPGRYTAHVQTDGSHAWDDWEGPPPPAADLWGVQVWRAPEAEPGEDPLAACRLPGVPPPPGLASGAAGSGGAPPEASGGPPPPPSPPTDA